MRIEHKGLTIDYDDSQQAKDKAFQLLLDYYLKHTVFDGESINQMDAPQIDAPILLSRIAKQAFKFDVDYKDE